MQSIFLDKAEKPTAEALKKALGKTFAYWEELEDFTMQQYPNATATWHFSSAKFGWSYRISDKKRVLVYLLPRDKFFKVAMVFGEKAVAGVLHSKVSQTIKTGLQNAKPYAEGRGIRIDIKDNQPVEDCKALICIKIAH